MGKLALFIFRRDLRLVDNTALIAALKNSDKVLPCFIFDPRQCKSNPYKSTKALQFMFESLIDLENELVKKSGKLFLFYGKAESVIKTLIAKYKIDAVYINKDYTPFSVKRDQAIQKVCSQLGIDFFSFDDELLTRPENFKKPNGTPYRVFTAFYKKVRQLTITTPEKNNRKNYLNLRGDQSLAVFQQQLVPRNESSKNWHGGRTEALKLLKRLSKLQQYSTQHNYPALSCTTGLSPHLKFGTISVREVYHALMSHLENPEPIIREIYWRDFFTWIAYFYPQVFGNSYQEKYRHLKWENNQNKFIAWCEGKTGFPMVDAGMRELNQTGRMHNRLRLITASFLVKDLHIDWRWGEQYFAQHLIDYDPAVNNGNWQWVVGTGTDAQPYFRIFNPWLQQKKFDPECEYIKRWISELKNIDPKIIHNWYKMNHSEYYLTPIVNHSKEAHRAIGRYRN